MMLKTVLILTVVAAVSAVPHKLNKATKNSRPPVDHTDYDCTGKAVGNHYHPTDCTRFIQCKEGGGAADQPCNDCPAGHPQCLGGPFLIYNKEQDQCLWPSETECIVDPQDPPEEVSEEPVTEVAPIDPIDSGEDDNSEDDDDEEGESEEVVQPERCAGRTEGASCEPDDCEHCGWCENFSSSFFRCNRTIPDDPKDKITGVIVLEHCDDDLWWNPTEKPKDAQFGGTCTPWAKLPEEVQNKYKDDENCVHPICQWGQDVKCSGAYWYRDPKIHKKGERIDYTCPAGLLWDPTKETCAGSVPGC